MPNIKDLPRGQVTREVEYLDRICLDSHIPTMQSQGQLIAFLVQHRKQKTPSSALLDKMAKNLARDAKRYAEQNGIPIVYLEHVQRKDYIAFRIQRRHLAKDGVVFIRIAQEDLYAFKGPKKNQKGHVGLQYSHQSVYSICKPLLFSHQ